MGYMTNLTTTFQQNFTKKQQSNIKMWRDKHPGQKLGKDFHHYRDILSPVARYNVEGPRQLSSKVT